MILHIVFQLIILNIYQIFSLAQLNSNEELLTDYCFVNCLKYFNINPDIIEFAKDIIRDIVPLKYLNKICNALGMTSNVRYVDNEY
jgi:hypothetical protein